MTGAAPRALEATVVALDRDGDGVVDTEHGRFSIAYAAPGDRYRFELRRGAVSRATRIADGPDRAPPPCPHFGTCGGCAVQHLSDPAYAAWKRDLVVRALARGRVAAEVGDLVRIPARSRRRARLSARAMRAGCLLGFNARRSHTIVDVRSCDVLTPELSGFLPGVRNALGAVLAIGEWAVVSLTALESGIDVVVDTAPPLDLARRERLARFARERAVARLAWNGEAVVQHRPVLADFGGVTVELPESAFLQPTAEGERVLRAEIMGALADAGRVGDLFAGCGAFAFPLAAAGKRVATFELDPRQTAAVDKAARRAGPRLAITVEARDLERRPLPSSDLARFDGVVLDPPRAGALAQCRALAKSAVATIAYVSCNPVTFARDAAVLVAGGYRLERVVAVDQFLWTPHVELAATFRRGHP
jgi:23S rRNA (uracil1939-C5)-methyltransferase